MPHLQIPIGALQQDSAYPLTFRLRQPLPAAPKACLILLHGVGGNETNLAELAAAVDPDVLVVLPRGPLQFAPGQFGWFSVAFTPDGPRIVESEAEASRQTLLRFIEQLQVAYGIAAHRTVIAGFSQGGILSASVGLSTPQRVAGFGVLSGRILPELEPHLAPREQLATQNAFIAHGQHDSKLPVAWAHKADQWLTALEVPHTTRLYPIDHTISSAMASDFLEWLHPLAKP